MHIKFKKTQNDTQRDGLKGKTNRSKQERLNACEANSMILLPHKQKTVPRIKHTRGHVYLAAKHKALLAR
eukprot:c16756_g2_i1 orf=349-558(-)